ncbi:MAG TPA: hypothetical protein VKZ85_08345 [Woeseiaceae bacterium]|nr:hypothetical protein [Woeseiaceae bacterium]
MPGTLLILIVDEEPERAEKLKSVIEFMDVPQVRVAEPGNWRSRIGDRRLAAVFISDALERGVVHSVIAEVGEHDPNVPIVVVEKRRDTNRDD